MSAAIIRDDRVLLVRRARKPAVDLFTCPGGVVEAGETLIEAVRREVMEETQLAIEPVALAGFREHIARDAVSKIERHFVILSFAARWISGEPVLSDELAEARWFRILEIEGLLTTEGLFPIIEKAWQILKIPAPP